MLSAARARAKKGGVPFELAESDITIPDTCPVLGTPLVPMSRDLATSPSIDRIDPHRGYVPGNVTVMSRRANLWKSNADLQELKKVLEWLRTVNPAR